MPTPPSNGRVTSPFGMRIHPITGLLRMHSGSDRGGSGNVAPVSGVITFIGEHVKSGFGLCIGIREDGTGAVWTVAHHSSLARYKTGDRISEGARTGVIGKTGTATGVHTHTERRVNSNGQPLSGTATDPELYYSPASGGGDSSNNQEDDMPSAEEVAAAVWTYQIANQNGETVDGKPPVFGRAADWLTNLSDLTAKVYDAVRALGAVGPGGQELTEADVERALRRVFADAGSA
jgi:murein DD-endopeptidase MepM/ murein hydrolase activator NlpD